MAATQTQFNTRLRQARERRGLTIEAAARLAKVSAADWGMWERGDDEPTVTPGRRIATALGVDLPWLAGLSDEIA